MVNFDAEMFHDPRMISKILTVLIVLGCAAVLWLLVLKVHG